MLGALVSGVDYVAGGAPAAGVASGVAGGNGGAGRGAHRRRTGRGTEAGRDFPRWDLFAQTIVHHLPFNVSGYPAIAVCSGFGPAGLPVSLQIVGKPFQESRVFQVADAFEKAHGFSVSRASGAGGVRCPNRLLAHDGHGPYEAARSADNRRMGDVGPNHIPAAAERLVQGDQGSCIRLLCCRQAAAAH